ncbi:methyl-accepting chemotaxis protein [Rhizobium sp. C4]|uniref:methyl-accepting chemotaxis protein n=1 Tax=Rhizobium sp. C4 TaxID=1349800 RepID=UPI001E28809B|nr:methyl-accepting chemotaxis protein [Rhizobium sp. C4]MCD2171889.1 methyl-accepting chemotaxis protein [Rhizobium sp. C4]
MSFASRLFGPAVPRQIGDLSNLAALAVVDDSGRIIWANDAFADLAGCSATGETLPRLLSRGAQETSSALATAKTGQINATLNGHDVVLRVAGSKAGQRLVTVEPAAPETAPYGSAFDVIWNVQAVAVFASDGKLLDASPLYVAVTGYSLAELKTMSAARLADPQEIKSGAHAQFWQRVAQEARVSQLVRQVSKTGDILFLQSSFYRIPAEDGQPEKILQFADDTTYRINSIARLDGAIRTLSEGDLMADIKETLFPTVDGTRLLFNQALKKLRNAFHAAQATADAVSAATGEITDAARNFSQRAEQQAAAIEETANSLNQVTEAASAASMRAEEAGRVVNATRREAEQSSSIVTRAIDAMGRIEQSSAEIGNIIGVIDEIAFQTNLLALNAGVEAARAGDAGKGFAVVAQEVRELAQRSANAAKEIKALVGASGENVRTGVSLVDETGRALTNIASQIAIIDCHVDAIATATGEQARSIRDINGVVDRMEGGTQQNAAMAEETTASIQCLNDEISNLVSMLSQFRTGTAAGSHAPRPAIRAAVTTRPAAAPVRRPAAPPSRPAYSRTATAAKQQDWEEF